MIGSVGEGFWKRSWTALSLLILIGASSQSAIAADCPPDALGTSRTLVVDPREHPRIGTMQYAETLPLDDHEVVLTFDDGPLPKYSNQVLDILASQCVKATFFIIGSQAKANPQGVRKLVAAGHTVGTHSQNHPLTFNKMSIEQAKQEVDAGIASTVAALGDASKLAPFFRIPGLLRAEAVETYLASRGIQNWSADFVADDWRHIPPARVYELAIQRLEEKGKGILLLHDIQPRTVAALPKILQELKARGYRIVHVVPATPEQPATPTEPVQWLLHPPIETVATVRWPKIANFVFVQTQELPAPGLSYLDWRDPGLFDRGRRPRAAIAAQTAWPEPLRVSENSGPALPVPASSVFRMPEGLRVTLLASHSPAKRPQQVAASPEAANAMGPISARARTIGARQAPHSRHAVHQNPQGGHAGRGVPKHAVQAKPNKRALQVAKR
ncbi:polysaccharide deacetylase family protein [Bradyrhizobium neotropicale]|uniref:polysaccharide deacetylase family protein n=1 Tax=Bradyrhizobium neotropicale TaxID=1497615 RepID=UPI001AD6BE35|nr:polysaccharide deacetylase family protein [Bradyrhizobium neotropicale]MBO4222313.1 polysaccharide deacetylase family protein [Bradyrhizobium neotropicale]